MTHAEPLLNLAGRDSPSAAPAASPPLVAWQRWFQRPLVDLGTIGGEHLQGIYSPVYDDASVRRYVHAQFREHAEKYARDYAADEYFAWLVSSALEQVGWRREHSSGRLILDIGSGAGNSIFPLLRLCPDAQVIASDLSVELLALLRQALVAQGLERRCGLLQLNAEELDFEGGCIDLVVGAAILHHLLSPERTIQGCARILKAGGHAVFFEPFENGNAVLSLIYGQILQATRQLPIAPEVEALLRALAKDNAVRKGRDKAGAIFAQIDDKWLFTRAYMEETAERAGFADCTIYPLHPHERQFARQIEVNLRLGMGLERAALPQWAWDIVDQYDEHFSPDLKRDLLIEGAVVLKK